MKTKSAEFFRSLRDPPQLEIELSRKNRISVLHGRDSGCELLPALIKFILDA